MQKPHLITLKDGRKLGYVEFGDPKGYPVIYCHGWPSGKYEALYFDPDAKKQGIRLIAADRPGMGDSTFNPVSSFTSWPDDVIQLIDTLGIDRFGVFGVSGGTPYALALTHRYPERIKRTYVYGGLAPVNVKDFSSKFKRMKKLALTANNIPNFTKRSIELFKKILTRRPKLYAFFLGTRVPREDRRRASKKGTEIFMKTKLDSIKNGADGATREAKLILDNWGFDLGEIKTPVKFWVGTKDDLTPKEMTEYLNETIAETEMKIIDNGTHFVITKIADEIFDTMKQDLCES